MRRAPDGDEHNDRGRPLEETREMGEHSHRARYREVAEVLSRHGLGYLLGVFGLERLVPFQRGLLGHARREEPYTRPEHVRLALEQLGPTFVKLGQILSTRPDLISPELQAELAKLQDRVPGVAWEEIASELQSELGRPPFEVFASIDPEPLAAASIGQAHAAVLPDGREVVVKVRRPGIVERVSEDLEILANLAARAAHRWDGAQDYDVEALAREFSDTLRAELDYLTEAANAERFAADFAGDEDVHIPFVVRETTTSRVLTLERIGGLRVDDLAGLDRADVDRRAVAVRATGITLRMVFEHGFFHADPHPGNLFIEPSGRIGVIDFGMVGTLTDRTREGLGRALVAIAARDDERVMDALLQLGVARRRIDRRRLREDIGALLDRHAGETVAELRIGPLLSEVLSISRAHRLVLPADLVLLLKMLVMTEGMAAQLDPEFALAPAIAPFARGLVARQYDPVRLARQFGAAGIELARLGVELPQELRRILADLEGGSLQVSMRPQGLEPLIERLERSGDRLIVGIIAAALIDGLGELMAAHPNRWQRWAGPLFSAGLTASAGLAGLLALDILKRRHRPSV